MKNISDKYNGKSTPGKEEPKHEPDPREPKQDPVTEPRTPAPERKWKNPYPWFPAIAEGKAGQVFISYIIVYYSLN